jgi:hypothetical protein
MFLSRSRFIAFLLLVASFCGINTQGGDSARKSEQHDINPETQDVSPAIQNTNPTWVTIYVHGTTTKSGLKLLSKFCPDICYGAPGVHHVNNMPEHAIFRQDVKNLSVGDLKRFDPKHFYTFGWSGALSFFEREKAGNELYEGIKNLLEEYKEKYGFYPKIRIMTFSHGGNVALNMVSHLPFFKGEHVHLELLIIASPVQKVTEHLIEHPEIDFIYTIASTRDLLQVVDNYKYEKKRYFPERFFKTTKNNYCQMKVFVNGRGLGHLDLLRSFMIHIPDCLNIADTYLVAQKSIADTTLNVNTTLKKKKKLKKDENPKTIEIKIKDDKFCFYKGYNLLSCVYGKRKK